MMCLRIDVVSPVGISGQLALKYTLPVMSVKLGE